MSTPPHAPTTPDPSAPLDADRRAALRKLGVMAALTPPTVMTLLLTPRSSAASWEGGEPPIDGG